MTNSHSGVRSLFVTPLYRARLAAHSPPIDARELEAACLSIAEVLHRELGDDKYRPAALLRNYVAAGWLGRKAGRGFYDYGSEG